MANNPYEAPVNDQNPFECEFAALLLKAREQEMSLAFYYRTHTKSCLTLTVGFGLGIAWFTFLGLPVAVLFAAGAFFGVLLRDFGVARQHKRVWKIQRKLLDWDKVRRMAAGESITSP